MIIIFFFLFLTLSSGKSLDAKSSIVFERIQEPRENVFTLLVPKGLILEGGAIRILYERFGGALNMVDCKFDLAVKSDKSGSVALRWLPEMLCIDTSQAWKS